MADLGWMDSGTAYFEARLRRSDLGRESRLPGWTGRHVAAHVAANARALGRLVHWARTGEERPMYDSPAARDAEIDDLAARLDAAELESLVKETAEELREVRGTAAELAAWVTGRGPAPSPGAPAIGRWL
ncbi:maleylpyruvate isomerase N-terminal domain-containing protein [Nonomuraea sp. NPDC049400]|uniref:maleylpyruvate isomerase N-terminal domain-containing protein n=1 Tax=Nonomuraea sp. NPDC049400 TaxID=3364352 RepID=UPI0037ADC7C4